MRHNHHRHPALPALCVSAGPAGGEDAVMGTTLVLQEFAMTNEIKTMERQGSESASPPQWMFPHGQAEDDAEIGVAGARRAQTTSERRASSDQRKRDSGKVRLTVWLPAEAVSALDAMVGGRMKSRDEALNATVHHLRQQVANGLTTVGAPAWLNGAAGGSPEYAAVGLRLPANVAEVLRRAGEVAGHGSLAESAQAAIGYVSRLLAAGTIKFTSRESGTRSG